MKINRSRAAHQFFDLRTMPGGSRQPEIQDQPGPVHAVLLDTPNSWVRHKLTRFQQMRGVEFVHDHWEKPIAVCGLPVGVVYPLSFQEDEDTACKTCLSMLQIRLIDEAEFWRQLRELELREYRKHLNRRRIREEKQAAAHQSDDTLQMFTDVDAAYESSELREGVDTTDPSTWVFPDADHGA